MINRNGVHLPDTTYGGNPIDWNCSSDSDDSLQRLESENAKLRELAYVSLNYCANGMCSIEDCCPLNTLDGKGNCGFIRTCRELGIEEVDWWGS